MIVTQFAAEVRKEYRERMNDVADALARGECQSFDHYKALTGEIAGLAYAERLLIDAAERVEKTAMEK